MKKKNTSIFIIIIVFLFLFSFNEVSAEVIDINEYSDSDPSESIQKIIDNSNDGDIINFNGASYKNLTIIINKKLDIRSSINTTIENSNNKNSLNTIFFINSSGFGTTITGFNLKNIYGNGITINNSGNNNLPIKIYNNNFTSFNKSAILLSSCFNIDIHNNNFQGSYNGIFLENCNNIIIDNNTFLNQVNSGIYFNKTIQNVSITWNIMNKNNFGIILNSINNENLKISHNSIIYSSNNNIIFEEYFKMDHQIDISLNAIYGSDKLNIYAGPCDGVSISIGMNWFGSNDKSFANLCPKIQSELLQARLERNSFGNFSVSFYSGRKKITDLPQIIVIFYLNNANKVEVMTINGVGSVDYTNQLINLLEQDNQVSAKVIYDTYTIHLTSAEIKEDYDKYIKSLNTENNDKNNTETSGNGTGNGTGDGNGNENGTGLGIGSGTGTGIANETGEGSGLIDGKTNENSNINTAGSGKTPITAKAEMTPKENKRKENPQSTKFSDSSSGGGYEGGSENKNPKEVVMIENTTKNISTNELTIIIVILIFVAVVSGSIIYNKKYRY